METETLAAAAQQMLEGLMRMLGWSIAVLGRCGATTTRTFVKRFDVTFVGWSFPIRQGVARIAASIFQGGTLACHPVWHWPRASHLSEMAPTRKEFLQWEERSDGKFRQAFVLCSDKLVSRCTKERNVAQCTWQGELFPVWVVRALWGLRHRGRRIVAYGQ